MRIAPQGRRHGLRRMQACYFFARGAISPERKYFSHDIGSRPRFPDIEIAALSLPLLEVRSNGPRL
jgi:hypothetical protein